MAAIAKLIRNAPRDSLEAFLEAQQCPLGERLRSFGPDDDYAGPLLKAVDELSDEEHARLTANADRVVGMTDEFGQTALLSVAEDRLLVEELENAHDRSLWVFLNEPDSFRRAEEIRYTDQRRQGRMWSPYEGPPEITPDTSAAALEAFQRQALKLCESIDASCEIYRRCRPNFASPDSELYQLTLYHDTRPDTYLQFEEERLVRRHRRPVVEASITYEPAAGVIEVVCSGPKVRDELARTFAETILHQEIEGERVVLRRYDLSPLLAPNELTFDPEDGIASVKVTLLRVQKLETEGARTTLEINARYAASIWDHAKDELGDSDLQAAGYIATQAKIVIKFLPEPGHKRGKSLPITITVAARHGCDLKSLTERERLVGSKYLKRWGLVVEV
jgi:hypothetical protein